MGGINFYRPEVENNTRAKDAANRGYAPRRAEESRLLRRRVDVTQFFFFFPKKTAIPILAKGNSARKFLKGQVIFALLNDQSY